MLRKISTYLLLAGALAASAQTHEPTDPFYRPRTAQEILESITPSMKDVVGPARYYAPLTFSGHRELHQKVFETNPIGIAIKTFPEIDYDSERNAILDRLVLLEEEYESLMADSLAHMQAAAEAEARLHPDSVILLPDLPHHELTALEIDSVSSLARDDWFKSRRDLMVSRLNSRPEMPAWMHNALMAERIHDDLAYNLMIRRPETIDFAYWDLPVPPSLPDDAESFRTRIANANVGTATGAEMLGERLKFDRINWIHSAYGGVQFSQAYLSPNWYQGGNNSLSLLINAGWDVALNQVFHPNLLLTSSVTYKLGLNSTTENEYHNYNISQDLFQWNLKAGVKAWQRWFYSFTAQFKTQLFNQYPADSDERTSAFLSPGDLNLGLGMTYNYANKKKTFKFDASIAPLSYNLRTKIDGKFFDGEYFNVPAGRKYANEYGSNANITMTWKLRSNIEYKTRLFLFTDYSYFQGDWENTLSFNFNKFLTTQIFWHIRYDSSTESAAHWKHFMMKEILSFGFSYAFSTKN